MINLGDKVKLNSGGPTMRVVGLIAHGPNKTIIATCVWNADGKPETEKFPTTTLTKVEE